MKVYLDDEKTHVDPCPHNGHSVGWTVMTKTIVVSIPQSFFFPKESQFLRRVNSLMHKCFHDIFAKNRSNTDIELKLKKTSRETK